MHKYRHQRSSNVFWDVSEDGSICLLPDKDLCIGLKPPRDLAHFYGSDQSTFMPEIYRRHPREQYSVPRWSVD
jgi:hypothetical protein